MVNQQTCIIRTLIRRLNMPDNKTNTLRGVEQRRRMTIQTDSLELQKLKHGFETFAMMVWCMSYFYDLFCWTSRRSARSRLHRGP